MSGQNDAIRTAIVIVTRWRRDSGYTIASVRPIRRYWTPMQPVVATRWERAYQSFETPEQELRKFVKRLRKIGADRWDHRLRVLEVCSGRGTGLHAWRALGFRDVLGVDFSPALVFSDVDRSSRPIVGDARSLPLLSRSVDVVVVQGGLHHLLSTADIDRTLTEMCRVLRPKGRIVIVEPWLTPFLRMVHAVCAQPLARKLFPRLNALATMIDEERVTYERWLHAPGEHLELLTRHVSPQLMLRRWGKIIMVGTPVAS